MITLRVTLKGGSVVKMAVADEVAVDEFIVAWTQAHPLQSPVIYMGQVAALVTDEPTKAVRAVNLAEVADVEVRGTARTAAQMAHEVGQQIISMDLDGTAVPVGRRRSAAEAAAQAHEPPA